MLQEMILQNRNHSSIILWGMRINESMDDDAFYNRTNKIAHQLDPQPCHLRRAIPSASCWKRRSTFPSRPHSVEQQTSQTRRSGLFVISK